MTPSRIEQIGDATLYLGDCRDVMREMDADSVDAVVTDPPYHLTTGKRGGSGPASLNENSPAGRSRVTTGFMGKAWDGGDLAHDAALWIEVLRVAKPGAYLLAFGGTRTFHRLMCAIEDAGWEIRDTIMWVYGSGFPKSHNGPWGGTALKPAWEPIIVARKPLVGTVEANVQRFGTGALNIDASRVETADNLNGGAYSEERQPSSSEWASIHQSTGKAFVAPLGRWPANLIHDGSDEVVTLFPETTSGTLTPDMNVKASTGWSGGSQADRVKSTFEANEGSAARFFYCAKASRSDRNDLCEVADGLPDTHNLSSNACAICGLRVKANGSGKKCECGDDRETVKLSRSANHHPTVKPTELMRYLCRLVTPPGGIVFDPFAGSGSTGVAALADGFRFVGIELEREYLNITLERLGNAQRQARMFA